MTRGGVTSVILRGEASKLARWARNATYLESDVRDSSITIVRTIHGARGSATTSDASDRGLRAAVADAESSLQYVAESPEYDDGARLDVPEVRPVLWDDATFALDGGVRQAVANTMIGAAVSQGFDAAGELRVLARARAIGDSNGTFRHFGATGVECSMTVRGDHAASGWAGVDEGAWARLDPAAIAARAVDKCRRSANPVLVEPGRYTVILEPQAVADLLAPLMEDGLRRRPAEQGSGPFAGATRGSSKIGERVLDRALTLRADPLDPDASFIPLDDDNIPCRPVVWVGGGILKDLSYDRSYAVREMGSPRALGNSTAFHLSGGTTSVDDMIRSTKRGLLVSRLSGVTLLDLGSVLCTGYTRDGTWLIENGAITLATKNFRFTESPLFVLNNVVQLGPERRVFRPGSPTIAPYVKVNDFSLTGIADAV